MIEDFFDHKCNIFHPVKGTRARGYGLPDASDGKLSYTDEPDMKELPCHFGVKSSSLMVIQQEPDKDLEADIKLALPAGTDIRVNDRVESCESGYIYEAGVPRNIRGHHMTVRVRRVYPKAL